MVRPVVVWGNCQAAPLAALIAPAMAAVGWEVVPVPPVFLVSREELAAVQRLVSRAAALVTQPVRDEYRWPGCGSDQLAARLPTDATLLRIPVVYDTSAFPHQVNAHGGDGARIDAPLTDYHDLRALVAAERGLGLAEALAWWPAPAPDAVRVNAAGSAAELARRDADLDVEAADLLGPGRLHTISHPGNAVLGAVALRVLHRLGIPGEVEVPARELLGERRAPVEAAVVDALGWPTSYVRPDWVVRGRTVPLRVVLEAHLELYRARPDIVADVRRRYADRLARLGL